MRVIIENLFIKLTENNKFVEEIRMDLEKETTFEEIKEEVSKMTYIPSEYFDIVAVRRDKKHLNLKTSLADYTSTVRLRMVVDVPQRAYCVQIFVKTLTGQTLTYAVDLDDPVAVLQYFIYKREGIPIYQQRLIHAGRQLEPDCTLRNAKIERESTLHLVLRLAGPSCKGCQESIRHQQENN